MPLAFDITSNGLPLPEPVIARTAAREGRFYCMVLFVGRQLTVCIDDETHVGRAHFTAWKEAYYETLFTGMSRVHRDVALEIARKCDFIEGTGVRVDDDLISKYAMMEVDFTSR